jgi:hypothetical protein
VQTLESGVGDVDVRSIRQTIGSTASVGFHPATRRAETLRDDHSSRVAMMPACRPRPLTRRGRATRRDDPGAAGGGATRERARARAALLKSLLNGTAN